jgi:hypothetical protein
MRANEEIDEESFKRKKDEFTKEKERIRVLLDNADNRVNDWLSQAEKLFTFAKIARVKFECGDLKTKKEILACLGSNLFLKDRKLVIQSTKVLSLLKKVAIEQKTLSERLEPAKNGLNKRKLSTLYAQSPVMHG